MFKSIRHSRVIRVHTVQVYDTCSTGSRRHTSRRLHCAGNGSTSRLSHLECRVPVLVHARVLLQSLLFCLIWKNTDIEMLNQDAKTSIKALDKLDLNDGLILPRPFYTTSLTA